MRRRFTPPVGVFAVEGVFWAQNVSKQKVAIQNVRLSCDCLKIVSQPKTIEPGKTGEIAFTYDGSEKVGLQIAKIFVQSEGASKEWDELAIHITLRPQVSVSPGEFRGRAFHIDICFFGSMIRTCRELCESNIRGRCIM